MRDSTNAKNVKPKEIERKKTTTDKINNEGNIK